MTPIIYRDLLKLQREIHKEFLQIKKKCGEEFFQLTVAEEHYLDVLSAMEKATFSSLAERFKVTRPAATKMVRNLVKEGYVIKEQNPFDKQEYFLSVRPSVRDYFCKTVKAFQDILDRRLDCLEPEELVCLKDCLYKMLQNKPLLEN